MNPTLINGMAGPWLQALERASWEGGLALGLIWAIGRLCPSVSPRARSWLWRLAYLKLVTTFLLPVSIQLPLLPAPVLVTSQQNLAEPLPPPLLVPDRVSMNPAGTERLSLTGWVLLAWSIGVVANLVRVLRGWHLTQALRLSCRPANDPLLNECCAQIGRRLGLRQIPPVALTDAVPQPLLLGPLRPVIVLPASLPGISTPERLRMLLAHELAHYLRRDLWWSWLPVVGKSLFFFHPLVWLSRAEWRLSQEMACDALAIRAAQSPLADYGTMLLEISTSSNGVFATPDLITVSIVETKRNLERRIKAMRFIGRNPSRGLWILTACLLGAATLAALPWRVVGQSSPSRVEITPSQNSVRAHPDAPAPTPTGVQETKAPVNPATDSSESASKAEGPILKVFSLKYANADELANQLVGLNPSKANQDPGKKLTVVADRRTNAIIVQGPPDELLTVTELVQVLDKPAADKRQTLEGETEARESSRPIPIMPPRPGFVQRILVTSGKTVRKGDALIELDDREAKSKLNYALAQLDVAKAAVAIQEAQANGVRRAYNRVRAVADKSLISSEELETKRTALEVEQARIAKAQAELRLAEQQVEQNKIDVSLLTLRAPVDGTVKRVRVQVGEYVSGTPAQPLMLISRAETESAAP